MKITDELINEIQNSAIGTPIIFNYFKVLMPDGREIKIEVNSIYNKTTPIRTILPKENYNLLYPDEG